MQRQLTQLELLRLTGSRDLTGQLQALDAMAIPYTARNPTGGLVIGVNVYTDVVQRLVSVQDWSEIEDENIDMGFRRSISLS